MNIIVIGLGSMGKRRIRLIRQYNADINIIGIDTNEQRIKYVEEQLGIKCGKSIKDIVSKYKIESAFVCTSPLSHSEIIKELLINDINVFSEINLVADNYDELIKLSRERNKVLFLSSTFLYRKDIQYIIEKVHEVGAVNYIYHTGQYLPDWHPWESFQSFFVSDKRTNGCREILAIEMPWIIECFGDIKKVAVSKDKISSLSVDYNDNYMILIEHKSGNKGLIAVDVVARKARRSLEVYNEGIQIFWDGTPNTLRKYEIDTKNTVDIKTYDEIQKDHRYCENIIENAYMDEIIAFFESVLNGNFDMVKHTFERDKQILAIVDEIEE